MLQFHVYDVELYIDLNSLKKKIFDLYFRYYQKNKDSKRYKREPEIKITEDIISIKFWVKNRNGIEKRIILDGTISMDKIKLHTVTLEGQKFERSLIKEFLHSFKKITRNTLGFLYIEVNYIPIKIEKGVIKKYNDLLNEIFNDLPEDKKRKHALSLQLLSTDSYGISF